jgi:hypothetical protein
MGFRETRCPRENQRARARRCRLSLTSARAVAAAIGQALTVAGRKSKLGLRRDLRLQGRN